MKICDQCNKEYAYYFISCPKCVLGGKRSDIVDINDETEPSDSNGKGGFELNFKIKFFSTICFSFMVLAFSGVFGLIIAIPFIIVMLALFSNKSEKVKIIITIFMSIIYLFMMLIMMVLIGYGEAWSGYSSNHGLPKLLLIVYGIFLMFIFVKLIANHYKNKFT
jgi:hypothetical protein